MKKVFILIIYNIIVLVALLLLCELFVRIKFSEIKPQFTSKNLIADSLFYDSRGLRPNSFGKSNGALVEVDQYGNRKFHKKSSTSQVQS